MIEFENRLRLDGVVELPLDYASYLSELRSFYEKIKPFAVQDQVNLKKRMGRPDWCDGVGSLYNFENKIHTAHESDFTHYCDGIPNSVLGVIKNLEVWVTKNFNFKVGRIRFISLWPHACLSYHIDSDFARLHIPIVTNECCFFVVNDQFYRMSTPGRAYLLRTDLRHTAINAHIKERRVHLVFSTF